MAQITEANSNPGNPNIPSSSEVEAEEANLSATFTRIGAVVEVSFLEYEKLTILCSSLAYLSSFNQVIRTDLI